MLLKKGRTEVARRKPEPETRENGAPSFEEALESLETIIEAMEGENLPLEDLVSHYEKGTVLLNRCESMLQTARGRIELITLRNQNEIGLDAAGKTTDAAEPPQPDEPDEDDNDIRLF